MGTEPRAEPFRVQVFPATEKTMFVVPTNGNELLELILPAGEENAACDVIETVSANAWDDKNIAAHAPSTRTDFIVYLHMVDVIS